MKKSKILAPALGVLVLSTAASISGTVAWFTANNTVAVSGMSVKTKVGSNLLIADISTANATDDVYESSLTQTRTALLQPASTVNGTSFFYHVSDGVHGDGSQTDDVFKTYTEATTRFGTTVANESARPVDPAPVAGDIIFQSDVGKYFKYSGTAWEAFDNGKQYIDATFNSDYACDHLTVDTTAFGYIDYEFYLKATSSAADQVIRMTKCNLLKDGAAISDYAWRVAVISQEVAKGAAGNAVGTPVSILKHASGDYFTKTNDKPQAAASTSALGDVANLGTAVEIEDDLDAGATQRYKVTVRLWLEGEDKSCNNDTYAALSTASWSLDIQFDLGANPTGVTEIGSVVPQP